ncbi:MAG: DNA recombination protein RmuC [Ktedonobacteraceae bacterium]|jgi:DNA recombination protein RmuC|nr:DNA recombination protein RmuC [Ktedonobacteraceae bacterium]
MLEWTMRNEGPIVLSAVAVGGVLLLILLVLSAMRQRSFRMQLTKALGQIQQQQGQIQQQQGLLHEQQKLFSNTFEQQTKALQGQVTAELLHTQQEVNTLSKALRTTKQQGTWGELQLLNCLKLAGMEKECDFEAQKSFPSLDRQQRPDVIIYIPPDRCVAIDAKAPLETYLTAQKRIEETGISKHMEIYTSAVRRHIKELAQKEYWQLGNAPEFVVLFLPSEAMFRAALEHDPALMEYGMNLKVMLASPISLLTLLKVIAYGWSVESRAQNVEQLLKHEQQIYRHLAEGHQQWNALRSQLDDVIKIFNKTMTAYAQTLAPSLEAMRQLDTTLKNSTLAPIHLLQRRLEPVHSVPEAYLQPKEERQAMELSPSEEMQNLKEQEGG